MLIKELMAFLLGRRYYANIVITRGTTRAEICSFIFQSRADALAHRDSLASNLSFQYIETISFRSRREYCN